MTDRPLYIDCQVFQSAAWDRGMGKYSTELLKSLLPTFGEKNTINLLFNDSLDIPSEVMSLVSGSSEHNIVKLPLERPREPREDHNVQSTRLANKRILNENISEEHDFFILSLFLDEVCPVFPDHSLKKTMVYYDTIPYLYHERYGKFKGFFDFFYLPHSATVFEADCLLSISETVANDLTIFLGIPNRKIINIDGAYIPSAKSKPRMPEQLAGIKNFVLMPSGQEIRKNNLRAVRAFRSFVNSTKLDIKLVVTSFFTEEAREELVTESGGNALFTGNVSSEELAWLYENSSSLLFASEYEGLGLPILEAAQMRKPIFCSNIQAFKEISDEAMFFFDPLDEESIKNCLAEVYKSDTLQTKTHHYKSINDKYTWKRSARVTYDALSADSVALVEKKPRIAMLCPDPSGFSAIGKVAMECHSTLSDYFEIDYFFDTGHGHRELRPNLLMYASHGGKSKRAQEFNSSLYNQYDGVVYHIGSSEYHMETIKSALCYPGYVILHDTNLGGVYDNLVAEGYMSTQRKKLEGSIDKVLQRSLNSKELKSRYIASVVNRQKHVIVHSDYALSAVKEVTLTNTKAKKLNLPVSTPYHLLKNTIPNGAQVIALAGILAGIKGISLIESIAQNPKFADDVIKLFGFSSSQPDQIERLSLLPNVDVTQNPTDFEFQRSMQSVDALINVRHNHHGETSLTTLEALRFGVAVAVRDFGWFAELPDDMVYKVAEGVEDIEAVTEDCLRATDYQSMKKRVDYIDKNYSHELYAEGLHQLFRKENTDQLD
jgi:glycosyltransferase involved in cell wall biosynthesis